MSNSGGFIVIDGSKIRAINPSLSDQQNSTLTGAQVRLTAILPDVIALPIGQRIDSVENYVNR